MADVVIRLSKVDGWRSSTMLNMIANIVSAEAHGARRSGRSSCRKCGEEILSSRPHSAVVFLDMELRKHTCPSRKNTGGNR
jgi:hypothetical protein